uniref:Uncharacterized protein n=1 Tax=Micrurus carvalhoi TaxID=3147026 RepID=A0A2H6N955_9SAUR
MNSLVICKIPYLGKRAEFGRDSFIFSCFFLQKGKIITGSLGKRVCALVFIGADCQFPTLLGQGNFWLVFFEADSGKYKLCQSKTVQITIVVSGKNTFNKKLYNVIVGCSTVCHPSSRFMSV